MNIEPIPESITSRSTHARPHFVQSASSIPHLNDHVTTLSDFCLRECRIRDLRFFVSFGREITYSVTKVGQFDSGHSKVSGGVLHHWNFPFTIYSSSSKNNDSSPENGETKMKK